MLFPDEYPIRSVGTVLFGLNPVVVDCGFFIGAVRNGVCQDFDCV